MKNFKGTYDINPICLWMLHQVMAHVPKWTILHNQKRLVNRLGIGNAGAGKLLAHGCSLQARAIEVEDIRMM